MGVLNSHLDRFLDLDTLFLLHSTLCIAPSRAGSSFISFVTSILPPALSMYTSYVLASAAALLGHSAAQSSTSSSSSTATAVTSGEITIHTVTVGKIENGFDPPSINAVPGDVVSFEFFPGNHSVARAEYGMIMLPPSTSTHNTDPQQASHACHTKTSLESLACKRWLS